MMARRAAGLLLSLWAGSLLTVCALAAPIAFAVVDRQSAGRVAAQLFFAETILAVCVATFVFIAKRIGGFDLPRSVGVAIIVGAIAPLASETVLGPLMQSARTAGDMARFGALHGVSALLFGIACVASVFAAWRFNRLAA
jgi:Domain of unknown function (DUF4149)